MKKQSLILSFALVLLGCNTEINTNIESYSLNFLPRKCNYLLCATMLRKTTVFQNENYYEYHFNGTDVTSASVDDFTIGIFTANTIEGNQDLLDTPIPSLENEIAMNYKKVYSAPKTLQNSSSFNFSLISINYSITGIKKLIISSVDVPLFSKDAGTSLNEFFDIVKYDPDFIASSATNRIIYGYGEKKPESIDQWLSLSPLGQPALYLHLNTIPLNLPQTVQFKVDMETNEGIKFSNIINKVTLRN